MYDYIFIKKATYYIDWMCKVCTYKLQGIDYSIDITKLVTLFTIHKRQSEE